MGKCIVCNKFAGPFYSLHKACYQVYEDTRECLQQELSKAMQSALSAGELAESISACKPATTFSSSLFKNLLKRSWQDQAKLVIKSKLLDANHAKYLLTITSALEIESKNVESNLFQRLANIEHLVNLQQKQPISKIFTVPNEEIDLSDDEFLIWIFEDVFKVEQARFAEQKSWTVFESVVTNLFNKSRYKELAVKIEATGKLAITTQNLYYITKNDVTKIGFADIYTITPMKDGVRIQTTQRDATSSTYITGDGRFTYTLLRYAQEQMLEE